MAIPQKNEERLMTGEELARHPELEPCELVDGRVVPMTLAGFRHGKIVARLGSRLGAYAEATQRGEVAVGDVGIYTRRDPDTVRGADVIFISHERYSRRGSLTFLGVAPELVVEVFSPEDRWSEVERKAEEYLSAGALCVWVADPRTRKVLVHRPGSEPETLEMGDILRDEEILPGFALPLSELFRD